jgi:hypothetical protein
MLLLLPSLGLGAILDDHQILMLLSGVVDVDLAWGNLFAFIPDDPAVHQDLMDHGGLPWWTSDHLKMAFLRPMASWDLALDQALFGRKLWLWHAHQLLWLGGFVAVGAAIHRRVLPAGIAGLAMLIWAVDISHGMPGAWIANRNALNAMLPATLGLLAHLRWREDGWKPGLPLSLAGFAIGLLGGEAALGILAYVAAYELVGAKRRDLTKLAPAAALAVFYLGLYKFLGLGTQASGIYVDPLASPGRWLADLPRKLTLFIGADFSGSPPVLSALEPRFLGVQLAVGAVTAVHVGLLSRWVWRHQSPEQRRALRWLLLGALGALLPSLSTFPAHRLLQATSLGTAAWIATLLVTARDTIGAPKLAKWAALPLAGVALVAMPLGLLVSQATLYSMGKWSDQVALSAELDDDTLATTHQVVLAASTYEVGFYLPFIRWKHTGVLADSWRVLSIAPYDHRFTRTGPQTLEMQVVDGILGAALFEAMFRGPDDPLHVGDQAIAGPMTAEILAVQGAGPTRVRFTFEGDLDGPDYRWLMWTPGKLVQVALPAVGESLLVPYHHPADPKP